MDKSIILNYHEGGVRQPRLHSAEHTGLMTVYRPNGDIYIVKGTKRRTSKGRTSTRKVVTVRDTGTSYFDRVVQLGATGNID